MSDDDILEITVRLMDGQSHNLQVPRNLLISDFKCLVEEQTNVPPERQRFIFQGQPLQSHKSLSDYNVRTGHVIHLVTRSVDAVNNSNTSANSSGSGSSASSNANFNNSFSAEGGMPQWRRFPVTIPGANPSHVMVGEMHIAQAPDGTTTTSWSSGHNAFNAAHGSGIGGAVAGVPQATEFINSIIHSLAHSAATNAASAAATVAHQFVNGGAAANSSNSSSSFSTLGNLGSSASNSTPNFPDISTAGTTNVSAAAANTTTSSSCSASSSSTFATSEPSSSSTNSVGLQPAVSSVQSSNGASTSTLSSAGTTAYTFPGAVGGGLGGIPGAQRFGPFVMAEYNGIPVAIGGALVGGPPISPSMFVGGFPGPLQAAAGGVSSSLGNVSNNTLNINYSSSNSTTGSAPTANEADNSTASTAGNVSSDNSNRLRSQSQGFGALLSNLIQHITPVVTSMTANAVSRYIPNMDGINDRNDSAGGNHAQQRYVANSGDLDGTDRGRSASHANNQTERGAATSASGGAPNEHASAVMREGLHEFIMNISNVMETASQTIHNASLKTAQIANDVMRATSMSSSSSASSSTASSTIYSNAVSASSTSSNPGFGTIRNTTGTGGTGGRQRLWISNDYVNERLPWDALNELLTLLQEETGWRRPRMHLPSSSNASGTSTVPISVFLSAYGQATNVMLTLFSQLQAWQDGYARLDVPRFGRTVQVLTRTCEIHAQLGSLLTWIFQNMVQHVEPESLNAAMGWSSRIVGNQSETAEGVGGNRTSGDPVDTEKTEKILGRSCENKSREERDAQNVEKDENEDYEFKGISMEEKEVDEASFVSKVEDSKKENVYSQNATKKFQSNCDNSSVDAESKYEDLPKNVRQRFETWTSDNIRFSQNILSDARSRPFSTSYKSGDATLSSSARNATQEAAERRFSLNWHRALSKLNIINAEQAPEKLNDMYMAWSVIEAIEFARDNPDYKAEVDRYPGIRMVLELLELIEGENKKRS